MNQEKLSKLQNQVRIGGKVRLVANAVCHKQCSSCWRLLTTCKHKKHYIKSTQEIIELKLRYKCTADIITPTSVQCNMTHKSRFIFVSQRVIFL